MFVATRRSIEAPATRPPRKPSTPHGTIRPMARRCFCGCGRRVPRAVRHVDELGRTVGGALIFLTGEVEPAVADARERVRVLRADMPSQPPERAPETPAEWAADGRLMFALLAAVVHGDQPLALDEEGIGSVQAWLLSVAEIRRRIDALGSS